MKRLYLGLIAAALVIGSLTVFGAGAAGKLTADDYIAIEQLYAKYNHSIDTGDAEAWAATFTPDGVFNNTNKGHDALVAFVKNWKEQKNDEKFRHWNTNLLITPTADGATGTVYLNLLNIAVRPAVPATTGKYEDVLVKTAQGWRFKTRVVKADPAPKPPTQ
jgi:actinorhodin biosynthesis protein ActVIA